MHGSRATHLDRMPAKVQLKQDMVLQSCTDI